MPIVPAANPTDTKVVDFEIVMQRRQIALNIKLYGIPIQIVRLPPKVLTNTGGVARASATPITFPFIKRLFGYEGHETQEAEPSVGIGRRYRKYIIGLWNDDLQKGDTFQDPNTGLILMIQYIHEDRTVETKAQIEPVS